MSRMADRLCRHLALQGILAAGGGAIAIGVIRLASDVLGNSLT